MQIFKGALQSCKYLKKMYERMFLWLLENQGGSTVPVSPTQKDELGKNLSSEEGRLGLQNVRNFWILAAEKLQ